VAAVAKDPIRLQAPETSGKLRKGVPASIIKRGENLMTKEDTIMRLGKELRWILAVTTLEDSYTVPYTIFRYFHRLTYVNQSKSLLTSETYYVIVTSNISEQDCGTTGK
jgi:hypothetical protein